MFGRSSVLIEARHTGSPDRELGVEIMKTLATKAYIKAWLAREDRGATAVEYGLMVALIAAVIIVAVAAIGTNLDSLFGAVGDKIPTTVPS